VHRHFTHHRSSLTLVQLCKASEISDFLMPYKAGPKKKPVKVLGMKEMAVI
jgi:hypothetical protein